MDRYVDLRTDLRALPLRPTAVSSKDDAATRRGRNNRARGNAIEREVARKLGLRRVGQYGGPEDAESEWLVVQVKSGGCVPQRYLEVGCKPYRQAGPTPTRRGPWW